jgi:CRP-like cAMP-binding protein
MLTARNGRRFASPDQRPSSRTLVHPPMPQGSLMPTRKPGPAANRLLTGLPRHDLRQVLANCDKVDLVIGDLLYEPGKRMRHVYFPIGGFISLIAPVDGHASLEVGLIGNEGMLGIPLMLGVNVSSLDALVQGGGPALRMTAALFRRELNRGQALQQGLNRYLYVLMSQLAQSVACTRFHVVEARLARWLLMTQDRARAAGFHITHESLGNMLGVRRVGVTKAAGSLQSRKLISYRRGDIRILDRDGLEAAACGCYQVGNDTYERAMGKPG